MTSSEDRYVKPAAGEDPRTIDREQTDDELVAERAATRQVSHPQEARGVQGISSDAPGFDASDRDAADREAADGRAVDRDAADPEADASSREADAGG